MITLVMIFWGFIFFVLFPIIDFMFMHRTLLGQIILWGVIIKLALSIF